MLEKLTKSNHLSTANPIQAERMLASRLGGDAKVRLRHAFQLSAVALIDEPDEWIFVHLQAGNQLRRPAVRQILQWIEETRKGFWLKLVISSKRFGLFLAPNHTEPVSQSMRMATLRSLVTCKANWCMGI